MIVADTNLLAYLVLPGPRTEAAVSAFDRDPDWALPPLWRSEFRNVLVPHLRRGDLKMEQACDAFRKCEQIVGSLEFPVSTEAVLDLVTRSRCTAYDCEFVALARALAVPLVTADADIIRDFGGMAVPLEEFARG